MKTYTTQELAELFHTTPKQIAKWFDAGRLQGYWEAGNRVIPAFAVKSFARQHGMEVAVR